MVSTNAIWDRVLREFSVAGHSLGGSLATLAAIDLQKKRHFPQLHVYTYGAPRTGNHAFSREYDELCPHTWHVINDRSPPFPPLCLQTPYQKAVSPQLARHVL